MMGDPHLPAGSPVEEDSASMVSRLESADRRAQDPSAVSGRSALWAVVGVVLLGALLRFYRIGNQSLWIDEITTLNSVNVGASLTWMQLLENIQGPLHSGIVWMVSQVTLREEALRSISAVASVATIPVVFLLGRDLFDRRAGLLAALFFAVSPFSIWYAQEIRNYALLHAFAAVSTLSVYRLVVCDGRAWAGHVVSTVAALYCNLSAAFLALGHNVFGSRRILRDRRFRRAWVVAYAVIVVLFVPSIWGVTQWVGVSDVSERVTFAPTSAEETLLRGETTFVPAAVPYSLFAMSYGFSLGPSLRALHLEPPSAAFLRHAPLVVPAGLAIAAALLLGLLRAARDRAVVGLILSVVGAVFGGAVLAAVLNVKPFNVRYVSVVLPVLVVLVGAGVGALPRWPRAALACAILLFTAVSLWSHYHDPAYWKEDVRAVTRYIEENERPGDIVVVPAVREVFDFYFRGRAGRFALYPTETLTDAQVREVIEKRAGSARRLWFIDARLWAADPDRRIPAYLHGHHELADVRAFPCAELSLFLVAADGAPDRQGASPPS